MSRRLQRLWDNMFSGINSLKKRKRGGLDTENEVIVIKRQLPVELYFIIWIELAGFSLFSVVNALLSAVKGSYGYFNTMHLALYLLFFILMASYTIWSFCHRKSDSVISALMFNVMVIMDTVLGYITGYDHCVGAWNIVIAVLCISILLVSPRIKTVFPVSEWNAGVIEIIILGGYCLTFLMVILIML